MNNRNPSRSKGGLSRRGLGVCTALVVPILLALAAVSTDLTAASGLFQSPLTATPESSETAVAPEPTTPTSTPEPEAAATESVTPQLTPVASPTLVSPPATALPTEPLPTEALATPSDTPEAVATETPPTPTEEPTASSDESGAELPPRYADSESDLRFDWGTLFDSLALGLSYAWLCCGVVLMLGLPILFVALWSRGRREQESTEDE